MPSQIERKASGIGISAPILGLASLPLAMLTLPMTIAVPPYFSETLGINLALIGTIFTCVRVFDIVIDPFIGGMMDATNTRWGKYRPWLLLGMPFLIFGAVMLFMAKPGDGPFHLVAGLVAAYLGWSIISLSQFSLGAGLSKGYAARSKIYAWIQAFFFLGTCLVMLLPMLLGSKGATASLDAMGWLIIGTTVPAVLIVFALIPEKILIKERLHLRFFEYFALITRPAVIRVLIADILFGLGFGIASAVLFFYFSNIKGLDRSALGIIVISQMTSGMLTMPLFARATARWGKHTMLMFCGFASFIVCPTIILTPHGSVLWAAVDYFLWGALYGGIAFIPRSMMADAADEVRLEKSADRTGVLLALLISSWKLGGALSVGIGFIALQIIGYQPKLGAGNSPDALLGLQLLFVGSPAILCFFGALACWGYPLTAKRYPAVRDALDAREHRLVRKEELIPIGEVAPAE